jgi:arylsulfatase A
MKTIDEIGARDNTLVIFTSDNGPETPVTFEESQGKWDDPLRDKCFGTPGVYRGMKRYTYEGGHRVPGIVRLPEVIPPGSTSDVLFNGTDILPTICEIVGIRQPEGINIDGVENFNAFLNNDETEREVPAIWFPPYRYTSVPMASMRFGDYSLIGWLPEKPDSISLESWVFSSNLSRFELYNIRSDPGQLVDLSEEKRDVISEVSPILKKYWIEMRDEGRQSD